MHDTPKLTSFLTLRANGWSLTKISRQIDVPTSTLWDWDNKRQNEIHFLKHLQLEKLQEKYLPTYDEELASLRSYLDRLEATLEKSALVRMEPGQLLQAILQVRSRLSRMRDQVPLRNLPADQPLAPLPFTGCLTREGLEQELPKKQNRKNPEKTPPGGRIESLNINDLQQPVSNGVPVLESENGHPK